MKKTKIVSIIICIVLCAFALISCGNSKQAYELYTEAEKATDALKRYDCGLIISLELSQDGVEGTSTITSTTTKSVDLENSMYVSTTKSEDASGIEQYVVTSHENGTTYYSDLEQCYKAAQDDSEAMNSSTTVAGFAFDKSTFKSAKVSDEDGATVITVEKAKSEKVLSLAKTFASSAVGNDCTIDSVDLTITIKDSIISSMKLDYSVGYASDNSSGTVKINVAFSFASASEAVSMPDGIADYPVYGEQTTQTVDGEEAEGESVNAAFELFESDFKTKVENYDELYAAACRKYGKDRMDAIISTISSFALTQNQ